ncbi:MAG TPA: hypothetical protein VM686_33100 [Polyangiaceae bacterium]|nr:hypothetical protein [Polyangiaceae bacterium]
MSNAAAPSPPGGSGDRWLIGYLLYEFVCQLLLLVPALGSLRVVWRSAAFMGSLALLVMLPGKALKVHPARTSLLIVVILIAIGALNPSGGGILAAVAHGALYVAILGPVFWVARLRLDTRSFERLLLVFWAYYTLSAIFGLLQVYFPGRFQPPLAGVVAERGPAYLDSMMIQLSSGQWVLRPMGLTDAPGGAASGGFYAALFGLGLFQARPRFFGARVLLLASMVIGVMVLYITQVRSLVVALGISTTVLVILLAASGRVPRLVAVTGVSAAIITIAYALAVDVAGTTVSNRLATLAATSPGNVYYTNRGIFLEHTFTELLPQFPLGGGLGRWGVMNAYFGSVASTIWVEIQWTAWLIDGGVLLILAYLAALILTIRLAVVLSLSRSGDEATAAAPLMAAYGVGVLALTFNAVPFMGTGGVEFWLLNAAFYQTLATSSPSRITA